MPKFNGTLAFEVEIEEQTSKEALDKVSELVRRAINSVNGVSQGTEMDRDINVEDDDEVEADTEANDKQDKKGD